MSDKSIPSVSLRLKLRLDLRLLYGRLLGSQGSKEGEMANVQRGVIC